MNNFLISTENLEELFDLSLVVNELKKEFKDSKFILFDTSSLYGIEKQKVQIYYDNFDKVIEAKNPYNLPFSSLSVAKKIYILMLNLFYMLKVIKQNNIYIMLTGVPLAIFRSVKIFNKKLLYISYVRGIIADPNDTSLSAKIHKYTKKLTNITSPLYSDYVAIPSSLNIEYFYNFGFDDTKLIKCGPIHLEYLKNNLKPRQDLKPTIIFATAAFSHHHLEKLESEQMSFLKDLLNEYDENYKSKYNFILRIHPRDNKSNYDELIKKYDIVVDTSPIEKFLESASQNKILLSAVSTLAFEWEYLGGKSYFYSGENIYKTHIDFYNSIQVKPVYNAKEFFDKIECNENINLSKFYYQHENCNNIKYLVESIKKRCL